MFNTSDVKNEIQQLAKQVVRNQFICFCINNFSPVDVDRHPVATEVNMSFFNKTYVAECVRKAMQSGKISDKAMTLAGDILAERI